MDKLYALQHLDGKHENSFVRKLLTTVFVEIFERGSKQVHYENIIVTDCPVVIHVWYSDGPIVDFIELCFVVELRELCFGWLKFDSNFLIRFFIDR